jgi:hypothetical protein
MGVGGGIGVPDGTVSGKGVAVTIAGAGETVTAGVAAGARHWRAAYRVGSWADHDSGDDRWASGWGWRRVRARRLSWSWSSGGG